MWVDTVQVGDPAEVVSIVWIPVREARGRGTEIALDSSSRRCFSNCCYHLSKYLVYIAISLKPSSRNKGMCS